MNDQEQQSLRTIKGEWLTVIVMFMVQSGAAIWWAADIAGRVENLEYHASKGERFTADDGRVIDTKIEHVREIFSAHINRTEPKIDEIHSKIINNMQ